MMAPLTDDLMGPKRPSKLFLDIHVSSSDAPSASSVQKPGTDLASNSQVDDLGNGKHLKQQEDPKTLDPVTTESSQLAVDIAEIGTRFRPEGDSQSMPGDPDAPVESQPSTVGISDSLFESAIKESQDTILTEFSVSLGDELRESLRETEGKQRSEFLPIDALDRIVTEERVREEIGKFSESSRDELDRQVQHVLGPSTILGQTTSRKKIFAILALIDKLESIWDFVTEGIYDVHLPFEKKKAQSPDGTRKGRLDLSRKSGTDGSTQIPIRAFHEWKGSEVTSFERTQWNVHIPIFFLNTKKDPKVRHYPLQESIILPFIEDDEVKQGGKMGGFADVWRVKVHPSHHNQGVLSSGKRENPPFAIKRLRYMDETAFRKEVQNLKRFSTRDYLYLIKLLGTYEWRHQYYLVFPWADGNLLDFWEKHPEPLAPKRDINTALWFSEQCLGLVEGMKMIHTWDTPNIDGQDNMFSFPTHQIHGLHGDLKPENILWFRQYGENMEKSSPSMGHFKISDFGLSHFHGTKSVGDIDARDTGFSPTYRAPERDVKGKVAQSYDVWSLACVLLEFASWYLGGYEEVKTFGQKRVKEDMQYDGGYKQDRFFNFMRASQGVADEIQGMAQICAIEKVSVVQEFEKLYDDPYCSDYLVDFLELVQMSLLRLGPEKRRGCKEIAESLQKLHANLQKDPSYGTHRVKRPPARSQTLESVLMEGDITPELKRQIRKSLPRRSLSYDREMTSISAALYSSPNSSYVNLPPSTARDPRPSSPEGKARLRLSTGTDLSPVQESPGTQVHKEPEKEQHSHPKREPEASEDTVPRDYGHTLSTDHATGLNIIDDATAHLISREEQHRPVSDIENTQEVPEVDNAAAEVMTSTERGLDSLSNGDDVANKSSSSKPGGEIGAEERTNNDDSEQSQSATNAVASHKKDDLGQPSRPTGSPKGENQNSSSSEPQVSGPGEHLEVPPDGGEGRPSSESPTLIHNPSDAGQEDCHDRRACNSSQTGSQGQEKMQKHGGTAESVVECENFRRVWFKSFLKKIPCFS